MSNLNAVLAQMMLDSDRRSLEQLSWHFNHNNKLTEDEKNRISKSIAYLKERITKSQETIAINGGA